VAEVDRHRIQRNGSQLRPVADGQQIGRAAKRQTSSDPRGSTALPLYCCAALLRRPQLGRPTGFTLVELLVSIAIIGVLVGLLLPAIQAAREAARRTQCVNGIRQLAIATHSYTETHDELPPSGIVAEKQLSYAGRQYPVYDQSSGNMFSWVVLLLPYMEESNLYDQFDLTKTVFQQTTNPQEKLIPALLCPSDAATGRYFGLSGKRFAKGNYAAYVSPFHGDLQLVYPGALIATGQKLSRITDGLSKTVVFAEVRTLDDTRDERGAWALPWNGATQLSLDMHHDTSVTGGYFAQYKPLASYAYQAQTPNTIGPNEDILVDCPSAMLVSAQLERMPCVRWSWSLGLSGYISAAPRSMHTGGVNCAYLDSHVDFIRDEIDPLALAYLVDIRDSKVTSNDGQ
jgi:prepilin-type N-terminal cleavage/methylation domain-containing protein/prepilin-type processing-associated H-X9-DG protein